MRQRRLQMPSPAASHQAVTLLCAFARTNEPESLFRGINSYLKSRSSGVRFLQEANFDEIVNTELQDSPVGREAKVFSHAKDCWALLEPGLVRRKDEDEEAEEEEENVAVGEHSWGLLEFYVEALEQDVKRARLKGKGMDCPFSLGAFAQDVSC